MRMDPRVLELHDEALRLMPEGASHDRSLCPICVDWSLDETGVPTCFDRLDEARKQAPFGDVDYADPGLRDEVRRYPLDTEIHALEVATLLARPGVDGRYSSDELEQMRQRTQAALERFGAKSQEAASQEQEVEEGGSAPVSDTIQIPQEAHDALLARAVEQAEQKHAAEIERLNGEVGDLSSKLQGAEARVTELETANQDLNGQLDQAQIDLKTVKDERDSLQTDIAERDDQARLAEVGGERVGQVKELGIFPDTYVDGKTKDWAALSDEDWAARMEEWQQAKGVKPEEPLPTDEASALNGTGTPPSPNATPVRAVLGLD